MRSDLRRAFAILSAFVLGSAAAVLAYWFQ